MLQSAGVAASRLTADGRSAADPVGDNRTAQGRAQNRRVAIIVATDGGTDRTPKYHMKKLLSFLVSCQFLAFVALVVVALVVWFVGPSSSFGEIRPLTSVGMRVAVIAILFAGMLFWLAEWWLSVVVAAALSLLIWNASSLIAFGQNAPFEPLVMRETAIAVMLLLFIIYWGFRVARRMHEDAAFLKRIVEFGRAKDESLAATRLKRLEPIVSSAISRLKTMGTGAHDIGKLFQGQRYLYELPW